MNNNQQLKKYFRRQVENLMFLYTSSLLEWCHMQNKVLSKYIDRYWWEQINMLKKLQEDLNNDYNTNLCILYKRLFDFKNPTTYFLKNLVWKPPLELIRRLREETNPNKKLKADDLSYYLKWFLHDWWWSNEWTTFFKDYKSLYYSVYACLMLYQKDKENFLDFLEHYLLTFITIQIIFDTLEQIKEKNYYQYLIKPRLFIEQTRKILWIISLELEKRIWKEKLEYCYKNVKKMLKNSKIIFDYKIKYLSEYVLIEKDIKQDEQSFDEAKLNNFPIFVQSYEELQWLNKSLDYQKYESDIIKTFKWYEEKLWFSKIESGLKYSFHEKLYLFLKEIYINDMLKVGDNCLKKLSFKNNTYENIKKELDVYIETMLSLYEQWIEKSIWKYFDIFDFNRKDCIHYMHNHLFSNVSYWTRLSIFEDYMFLDDMWKWNTLRDSVEYIDCETWEIEKWKEKDFFDFIMNWTELRYCININISLFNRYLTNSSSILWQQYFFIKIFDYLLNKNNYDFYLHKILSCIMYTEINKFSEEKLKERFSVNYVKCNLLNIVDTYYDNYFNKDTKEELMYTNNEIRKNYLTLSQQLVQLKKLFSTWF